MSRIPANPYRVYVQRKAQGSGVLPPMENHSFANLTEANQCRDEYLKRPWVRHIVVAVVLDECSPSSYQTALDNLERMRAERAVRVAVKLPRI